MADVDKQNTDHQDQSNLNEDNISLLMEQIYEQLIDIRQDDLELAEKLISLYDSLCYVRQTLTNSQNNFNTGASLIKIEIDSPTLSRYQTKPRSDSEPNIL